MWSPPFVQLSLFQTTIKVWFVHNKSQEPVCRGAYWRKNSAPPLFFLSSRCCCSMTSYICDILMFCCCCFFMFLSVCHAWSHWVISNLSYPVLSPRSSSIGTASMGLSPSRLIFSMDCEISLSFSPATNWAYTVGRSSKENPLRPRSFRATDISWKKRRRRRWWRGG